MRAKLAAFFCLVFLFSGCSNSGTLPDRALALRSKLIDSDGCSFQCEITADYGEKQYVFSMDCKTDREGNLTFTVTKPATIHGITGKIAATGGAITFDDKVLAFQTMADGQLTPVTAPWLLIKTLRSGYIRGISEDDEGFEIAIDDSYAENTFRLNVEVEDNLPESCEIFWEGRRVLTVKVEEFIYL